MTTVVGSFKEINDANSAVEALRHQGFGASEMNILARKEILDDLGIVPEKKDSEVAMGTVAGAASGATFGTFAGLFLGLTAIAVPGVAPVLSVGALATILGSTVIGAGVGAAAGGLLLGALVKMGVPEDEAHLYSEGIKRGGVLVAVQTDGDHTSQIAQTLRASNAVDIDTLEDTLQEEGWRYSAERDGAATPEQARV